MWFEARKQERKIRSVMVDHKRRQERRRNFYEKIRKDPIEFMQIHGRRCKIHVDPAIAQAAENAAILRPWQGDPQVLIDRFDARSHLEAITEYKGDDGTEDNSSKTGEERRLESKTNYERYRILVLNDLEKTPEDKFLKQIYTTEYFGGTPSQHEAKKKKSTEHRAAIAYTYEDSTGPTVSSKSRNGEDQSEDDEEETDEEELADELLEITERRVNVTKLSMDQCKSLNQLSTSYSILSGDFTKFMWEDHEEEQYLQQLKELEREKASLSGKQSRRERKLLKEVHARSRGRFDGSASFVLIQPLRPDQKIGSTRDGGSDSSSDSGSGSNSRDTSPDGAKARNKTKIEYITSFGGENEDKRQMQQPARKIEPKVYSKRRNSSSSSSSNRRTRMKRQQNDTVEQRPFRRKRSRSSSRDGRAGRHSPIETTRRKRYRRSSPSSSSSSSSSGDRRPRTNSRPSSVRVSAARSGVVNRNSQEHPSSRSSSHSESELSMMSFRSSMSEQEQERRQVENTKRRLKNTMRKVKERSKQRSRSRSPKVTESKSKPLTLRERLALQTQKALKRTVAKDKEDENRRREEILREQLEREEEMREMTNLIKQKEREKRDREVEAECRTSMQNRERRSMESGHSSKRRSRSSSSGGHRKRHHSRSTRRRHHSSSRSTSPSSNTEDRMRSHHRSRDRSGRDSGHRRSGHGSGSRSERRSSRGKEHSGRGTRKLVDY